MLGEEIACLSLFSLPLFLGIINFFNVETAKAISMLIILIYLVSFESYNAPICAPFSPLIKQDLKDGIYKGFLVGQKLRPLSLGNKNKERIKENDN